jgi:Zn finger protein HypA/HybF involved in hydrogenase expression
MNQQIPQVIHVQAEVRKLDINKIPPEIRCPECGDLLHVVPNYVYEGSPILICYCCRSKGIYNYYYLAPKGALPVA